MNRDVQSPWKYVVAWLRIYYGANLIYSSVRYLATGFIPEIPGAAGAYVDAAKAIYIYQGIKFLECFCGILLVTNRNVLLALVLEMPTTFNIFWMNTFIVGTPRQLFSGPQELLMNVSLLLAYGGHYATILQARVEPVWLWDGWKRLVRAREGAGAPRGGVQQADA